MATYTKGKATKLAENFNSTEFDCKGKGCCKATFIDKNLVTYLQMIRNHFGKPITVTSGYRCIVHNKNVNGAVSSRHTKGQAADIVVKGVESREVAKYAESIGIKGIGLYETDKDGHFVHIDTRETKYFWYGQSEKAVSTFNPSNSPTNTELAATNKILIELPTLYPNNKNKYVKVLQSLLGTAADGVYGKNTKKAVLAIQKKKGLKEDGICSADTWSAAFS